MEVKVLEPIGYCFGVIHAINKAKEIKEENKDKNVFLFGQLVHNNEVTEKLKSLNIETIDTSSIKDQREYLKRFTKDDFVIFSAHGHDTSIDEVLDNNHVFYYDAICPKVRYNREIIKKETKEHEVIYIGKKNHPETTGCLSISDKVFLYDIHDGMDYSKLLDDSPLITNQTTLSFLELKDIHEDILRHLPKARFGEKICDATLVRQKNIAELKENDIDLFLILGSVKSSNTTKLYEIADNKYKGITYLCANLEEVKKLDLTKVKKAVITSGTSTSMDVIDEIVTYLKGI